VTNANTQIINEIVLMIKDEVLLTVSCPIFPFILMAKNLLTGSLKNNIGTGNKTQRNAEQIVYRYRK
jgi:hypothetical protein